MTHDHELILRLFQLREEITTLITAANTRLSDVNCLRLEVVERNIQRTLDQARSEINTIITRAYDAGDR